MSNLNSSFDILRGWPHGGAIDENYPVTTAASVVEGQFVIVDTASSVTVPTVKLPTALAAEAATTPTRLRMVIQGTDQFDGNFVGKCTTLRGNFTVQLGSTQFVAGSYTPGQLVTISVVVDATQGLVKARAGTEQVVGEVESYDSTNALLVVSMRL